MVGPCPQPGEGREHQVHQAVEVGHVAREDLEDGLGAEEDEGSLHGDFEGRGERAVRGVEFSVEVVITSFLDEFVALPGEELRGVGFLQEEEAEALHEGGEDCGRVETPPPGCVLADEAAGDGANGWA